MKLLVLAMTVLVLSAPTFAKAQPALADKCIENDGAVMRVVVYADQVVFGPYKGMLLSKPEISDNSVVISKVTLNDGMDGWLDDVRLEITAKTVKYSRAGSHLTTYAVVPCN